MQYPKINETKLDSINRKRFDSLKKEIVESIIFDNKENQLGLSAKDIDLISWNLATNIIVRPY